jgi:hypothetical protein
MPVFDWKLRERRPCSKPIRGPTRSVTIERVGRRYTRCLGASVGVVAFGPSVTLVDSRSVQKRCHDYPSLTGGAETNPFTGLYPNPATGALLHVEPPLGLRDPTFFRCGYDAPSDDMS